MAAQVPDQTPRDQYTASASQTVFAYTFLTYDKDDLNVNIDGVNKVIDVDYTVSGLGVLSGGDITLTNPALGGELVTITRDMGFDRETDYQDAGDFLADTVNLDFNRLWLAIQQNKSNNGLLIGYEPSDDFTGITLPAYVPRLSERKSKGLAFDAIGNLTVVELLEAGTSDAALIKYIDLLMQDQTVAGFLGFLELGFRSNGLLYIDSGVSDAYQLTSAIAVEAVTYLHGEVIYFAPSNPNLTTTPTVQKYTLGTRPLSMFDGTALPIGFLDPARGVYAFQYDGSGYRFLTCGTTFNEMVSGISGAKIDDATLPPSKITSGVPGTSLVRDASGEMVDTTDVIKRWVTHNNSGQLTSGSDYAFEGIPDNADEMVITGNMMQATVGGVLRLNVGIGAAPSYLTGAGDYQGDTFYTNEAVGAGFTHDTYMEIQFINSVNTNCHFEIRFRKVGNGTQETWAIFTNGTFYDGGLYTYISGGETYIKGSSLLSPLSAVKLTLAAGTFVNGYMTCKYYGNPDV